ncbi:hypothetical protein RhiJN_26711 [Ceratobasidium sp. AG-Ba]|nr:hypothetical protein RhiJN_12662 [Ceratobasidium sp. AG-Ba]QRV98692.1 hypothetical protein RhiJN_26711 [Ceratobasidium sp. AG-Ba]
MSTVITSSLHRTAIKDAVVLVYMLLACFPVVWDKERASVLLVLEHILNFNIELGRIVLNRKGYEEAQKLVPQLLVLASRHGFVYNGGDKPTLMDIAEILQSIVGPLVASVNALTWAGVYLTEDDARHLLSLPLARLQTMVDEWVCEQSDMDVPKTMSSHQSPNICLTQSTGQKHREVWWATGQSYAGEPPHDLDNTALDSHASSSLGGYSSRVTNFIPSLHPGNLPPQIGLSTVITKSVGQTRNVVWWASPQATLPQDITGSKLASTPPSTGTPPNELSQPHTNTKSSCDLKTANCGDVWWKPLVRPRAPLVPSSQVASGPKSTSIAEQPTKFDSNAATQDQPALSLGQLLPGLVDANIYCPGGLYHPRPVRAFGLSRFSFFDAQMEHNAETDRVDSCGPTLHPLGPRPEPAVVRVERDSSHTLSLPNAYRPWIDTSSTRSSQRDFSASEVSLGPVSPIGSLGCEFCRSVSSFGPTTPTDWASPWWRDDHYLGDIYSAPEFDDASPAQDLRSQAEIEVPKAKEMTTGRRLRRKLKAIVASVRKAYD